MSVQVGILYLAHIVTLDMVIGRVCDLPSRSRCAIIVDYVTLRWRGWLEAGPMATLALWKSRGSVLFRAVNDPPLDLLCCPNSCIAKLDPSVVGALNASTKAPITSRFGFITLNIC